MKESERRLLEDRRRHPTRGLSRFVFAGRRATFRRREDQQIAGYVDRYGWGLFILLVLILSLNVLDALLTMVILSDGGHEMNPVVCSAIQLFGNKFWIWKFFTVSIPVILLCLHSKFRLVMPVLFGIGAVYVTVVLFEVFLIVY